MDLILHVGLPKTGTTTIQRHILAGTPIFLGRDKWDRCLLHKKDIKEIRYLATRHRLLSPSEVQERTDAWADSVRAACTGKDLSQVILSEENLVKWPSLKAPLTDGVYLRYGIKGSTSIRRQPPLPVAEYIKHYLNRSWVSTGKVRILLTLRNQSDRLASGYAESSAIIPRASQKDFEAQVERILADNDPMIDYYEQVKALEDAVGKTNVRVLLFEDMKEKEFWKSLCDFIGLDRPPENLSTKTIPKENARASLAENVWSLQPRTTIYKAALKEMRPNSRKRPLQRFALSTLGGLESKLLNPFLHATRLDADRSTITLTPAIRTRIQEHCRPSNDRLSAWLGRDISVLGY